LTIQIQLLKIENPQNHSPYCRGMHWLLMYQFKIYNNSAIKFRGYCKRLELLL
jgi:hypothetical protein